MPTLRLTRRYEFAASHRLYRPDWPDAVNWEIFGLCNNPNGHGHNYELEVTVAGEPDPETGMLIDIVAMDRQVQDVLIQHLDHKHLNLDVHWFQTLNPTAENIVVVCWQQLAPVLEAPRARLAHLRLLESRNNVAEFSGQWETCATT